MGSLDSDDDDNISLTSTVSSEAADEYEVECVLAERFMDGEMRFLVKWEGYPLERCSWEPEDNFLNPQTLKDWAERKRAIERGDEEPFDVDTLEERCFRLDLESEERKEKRKRKRERLALKASTNNVDDAGSDYSSNSSVEEPLMKRFKVDKENHKPVATKTAASGKNKISKQASKRPNLPPLKIKSTTLPLDPPKPTAAERAPFIFGAQGRSKTVLAAISPKRQGTLFTKLSTERRHQKRLRRDRAPDISQLDLRRPQDWLHAPAPIISPPVITPASAMPPPSKPQTNSNSRSPVKENRPSYSLFVEQDVDLPLRSTALPSHKPLPQHRSRARRSCNPGEVLAGLTFSSLDKKIDAVRIVGLNPMTRGQLLVRGVKFSLIEIDFKETCTIGEYEKLCDRRQNNTYSNAWIIPFPDTSEDVTDIADYLRKNDLAAVWRHPDETVPTVLMAYASSSCSWGFLDQNLHFPPNSSLRIVARSYLAPVHTVRIRVPTVPAIEECDISIPNDIPFVEFQKPILPLPPTRAPKNPPVTDDAVTIKEPATPTLLSPVEGKDLEKTFKERWNITYDLLTRVNGAGKDAIARTFYLHFPPEEAEEFKLVTKFLRKHTEAIFSNRIKGDWGRFCAASNIGTVLFHQGYPYYEFMPKLYQLIRKPFNFFNISLAKPVNHTHDGFTTHLQRLFPDTSVVLMTEDYILRQSKAALDAMKWFRSYTKGKFPGTWKMFFRPSILEWLRKTALDCLDENVYLLYDIMREMMPDYPEDHGSPRSLDGEVDDEGQHHPFISPSYLPNLDTAPVKDENGQSLSEEERSTDQLVEFFAGWSILNCHRYRRFIVLSHSHQKRWEKWQHLEQMDTQSFSQTFTKRPYKQSNQSHCNGNSSTTSGISPQTPQS